MNGSVRRASDRVRVTAQLILGETSDQLWTDEATRPCTLAEITLERTLIECDAVCSHHTRCDD